MALLVSQVLSGREFGETKEAEDPSFGDDPDRDQDRQV